MKKQKITLVQANALIRECDHLFTRAANAWVRGSNSGDTRRMTLCNQQCQKLRDKAEAKLKPLKIEVDFPGLYPSFKVCGYEHHSTESAVSAALEVA